MISRFRTLTVLVLALSGSADELGEGLVAEYFDVGQPMKSLPAIPAWTKPVLRRVEPGIDHASTTELFAGTRLLDHFAARWTGLLRTPKDATYTFILQSDDGSKLWIDGKVVVDHDGLHGFVEKAGQIELKAGDHEVRVEFFENDGGAGCRLSWEADGIGRQAVPASALFHRKDPHPPAGADASVKLAWKLASTEFVRYRAYRFELHPSGERILHDANRHVGLFGYEIEKDTLYHPRLQDWMEIPLILSFSLPLKSLRIGQKAELDMPLDRGWDYEPLQARGSIERVRADVGARLRVSAKLFPLKARKLYAQRSVTGAECEATVDVDPERGVVTRVRYDFSITFATDDPKKPDVQKRADEIQLVEVLAPRHAHFEAEVNQAIDRGIEWVWRHYSAADGHWGAWYDHKSGPTALALLTILKGSLDRQDERLVKAFEWLLKQPFSYTYDTAIAMMAVEAWYSPIDPSRRFKPGELAADKDIAKAIDPAHKKWMEEAARWLASKAQDGWWAYPAGERDFSNSQYGVLGLLAALRCGVTLDDRDLHATLQEYLRAQKKSGPKVKLSLLDADPTRKTTSEMLAEARGWSYRENPDDYAYPSMSAGGLGSLVVVDWMLRRMKSGKYNAAEQRQAADAIRDGWGWFADNWTMKHNRGRGRDPFYYLYGLERAANLSGVAKVNEHDWYWEGSTWLVTNQANDGHWFSNGWSHLHDTCFAVLFLKRATIRVATKDK